MEAKQLTIELVDRYTATDARTTEAKKRTMELVTLFDQPFSRDAQPYHVTASAVVVSSAGVLLHKHKSLGIWVGPGGHVDAGEAPTEAVLREVREEAGLVAHHPDDNAVVVDIDVHSTPDGHVHHDLRFLLTSDPVPPAPAPGESPEVEWVSLAEALKRTDLSFRLAIVAACKRLATPLG